MKASIWRGVAVLAFGYLVHSAQAITVTFGELHSRDFLDVTIDASVGQFLNGEWRPDGGNSVVGQSDGWALIGGIGWTNGVIAISAPAGFSMTYLSCELQAPNAMIGFPVIGFGWQLWDGRYPHVQNLSPWVERITWNVPETGGVGAILSATLIALVAVRRRTEILHNISRRDSDK